MRREWHGNGVLVLMSIEEGPFQEWRRCQFTRVGVSEKDPNTHIHALLGHLIIIPGNSMYFL